MAGRRRAGLIGIRLGEMQPRGLAGIERQPVVAASYQIPDDGVTERAGVAADPAASVPGDGIADDEIAAGDKLNSVRARSMNLIASDQVEKFAVSAIGRGD